MYYYSTRDVEKKAVTSAEAIKLGQAPDGGLFIPDHFPKTDKDFISSLADMCYAERAAAVLSLFLTDYTHEELLGYCREAYGTDRFSPSPAPVVRVGADNVLELWHGPTCAFKDLALQLLPRLLSAALNKTGETDDALILVATSGDTGKAALEGYRDVGRVRIMVFYPSDGVSEMQKLQMASQQGSNVAVAAIRGNFDDAQSGVKRIFSDPAVAKELKSRGMFLNSANSINIGRLVPQIVYYFSAYTDLVSCGGIRLGDKLNVTVPTGNFGNILACWIAGQMGLPVGTLVCATNSNKVLADYFTSGIYDKNRKFYTTISPSMDILVSSNLERLICFAYGPEFTADVMLRLKESGRFSIPSDSGMLREFAGVSCNEDETRGKIAECFTKHGYCPDPHTAVALACAEKYRVNSGDMAPMLVVSTASPYKFPSAVASALGIGEDMGSFELLEQISAVTKTQIPSPISALKNTRIRFGDLIDDSEMKNAVIAFAERSL